MTGYTTGAQVYDLEVPSMPGFLARVRSIPVGAILQVTQVATALEASRDDDRKAKRRGDGRKGAASKRDQEAAKLKAVARDAARMGKVLDLFNTLGSALVSWNMQAPGEDPGDPPVPIPATAEGLQQIDITEAMSIFTAWIEAVSDVDDPLVDASTDGDSSVEASLATASRSASRAS